MRRHWARAWPSPSPAGVGYCRRIRWRIIACMRRRVAALLVTTKRWDGHRCSSTPQRIAITTTASSRSWLPVVTPGRGYARHDVGERCRRRCRPRCRHTHASVGAGRRWLWPAVAAPAPEHRQSGGRPPRSALALEPAWTGHPGYGGRSCGSALKLATWAAEMAGVGLAVGRCRPRGRLRVASSVGARLAVGRCPGRPRAPRSVAAASRSVAELAVGCGVASWSVACRPRRRRRLVVAEAPGNRRREEAQSRS